MRLLGSCYMVHEMGKEHREPGFPPSVHMEDARFTMWVPYTVPLKSGRQQMYFLLASWKRQASRSDF